MKSGSKNLKWLFAAIPAAAVAAVALVFGVIKPGQGQTDVTTEPALSTEAESGTAETAESRLAALLSDEKTATVELTEDIVLTESLEVRGEKILSGSGVITMNGKGDYILVINDGASLTLDGVTLDGTDGPKNGVYVSEKGSFTMKSGAITRLAKLGVRVVGKAAIEGGTIDLCGSNWLYLQSGAEASVTGGDFDSSSSIGIQVLKGAKLSVSGTASFTQAGDNFIFNRGEVSVQDVSFTDCKKNYALTNNGVMSLKNVTVTTAEDQGLVYNYPQAELTMEGCTLSDSNKYLMYNNGKATVTGCSFSGGTSDSLVNQEATGELLIEHCSFENPGSSALYNKLAKLTANGITVKNAGNHAIYNRGGSAVLNDFTVDTTVGTAICNDAVSSNDPTYGDLTVSDFNVAGSGGYGASSYGGSLKLESGVLEKASSYCLYIKDGRADLFAVDIKGTRDGERAAVAIGTSELTGAVVTMTEVTVTGGARGISNHGTLTFNSGKIYGNTNRGNLNYGGGVYNFNRFTMNGGTITGNVSSKGGGGLFNAGTAVINGGTINGNTAKATSKGEGGNGGGILNGSTGILTVQRGTISGNKAERYGGGISSSNRLTVSGGTISGNSCGLMGGGIHSSGTATLGSVTITGNTASASGAGFYNTSKGSATIGSARITGNTAADNGGGVYNAGKLTISGGNFAGNKVKNKNGAAVWSNGTLTVKGGSFGGNTGAPYDIYVYAASGKSSRLYLSGSPVMKSLCRSGSAVVEVSGNLGWTEPVTLYLGTDLSTGYAVGRTALNGTQALLKSNVSKFALPAEIDKVYISENGVLMAYEVEEEVETKLYAGSDMSAEPKATGSLANMVAMAEDGDTVVICRDLTLDSCVASAKNITVTDDGAALRRLFVNTPATAAVMVQKDETEAGFTLKLVGTETGGLLVQPAVVADATAETESVRRVEMTPTELALYLGEEPVQQPVQQGEQQTPEQPEAVYLRTSTSAAFIVSSFGTLDMSGNITLSGLVNTGTGSASNGSMSGGKYGAAITTFASGNPKVLLDGVTIKDCSTQGAGAALYLTSDSTIKNTVISGCSGAGNYGGGIYVTAEGKTVTLENLDLSGCTAAQSSHGVYAYKGTVAVLGGSYALEAKTEEQQGEQQGEQQSGQQPTETTPVSGETLGAAAAGTLTIAGRLVADRISVKNALVLSAALEEGSDIGVKAESYVVDTEIVKAGAGVDAAAVEAATACMTLLNNAGIEQPVLKLAASGKLEKIYYPSTIQEAELWRSGTKQQEGDFTVVLAAAQAGDTIKLLKDITLMSAVTVDKSLTVTDAAEGGAAVTIYASGANNITVADGVTFNLTGSKAENLIVSQASDLSRPVIYATKAEALGTAVVNVENVLFTGLTNTTSTTGVIFRIEYQTLKLKNVTVKNITAEKTYAAVVYNKGGVVTADGLTVDTVSMKHDSYGGALYAGTTGASMTLENVTLSKIENKGNGNGAALYANVPLSLKNVTVNDATAKSKGASLYAGNSAVLSLDGKIVLPEVYMGDGAIALADSLDTSETAAVLQLGNYVVDRVLLTGETALAALWDSEEEVMTGFSLAEDGAAVIIAADGTLQAAPDAPDPVAFIGEQGYLTLESAVAAVQSGDIIVLKKDVKVLTTLAPAKKCTITTDGSSRTITNAAPDGILLQVNANRTVTLGGSSATDTLTVVRDAEAAAPTKSCLTVKGTLNLNYTVISGITGVSKAGPALEVNEGTANLTGCSFTGNETTGNGGVIFMSAGTVTADSCSFTSNKAKNGGGIYANSTSKLTLTGCSFSGNECSNGEKGYGSDVYLTGGDLSGAALYLDGGSLGSTNGKALYVGPSAKSGTVKIRKKNNPYIKSQTLASADVGDWTE